MSVGKLLAGAALVLLPHGISACRCGAFPSVCEAVENADVVVRAVLVSSVEDVETTFWTDSVLEVVEVFKSETGVEKYAVGEEFNAFTPGSSNSCGAWTDFGEEYLVDLVRRETGLYTNIPCGISRNWSYLNEDDEESLRSCTCAGGCGIYQQCVRNTQGYLQDGVAVDTYCADVCDPSPCDDGEICELFPVPCIPETVCPPLAVCTPDTPEPTPAPTTPVNPCLDPSDTEYLCSVDAEGHMYLNSCAITDEDVEAEYLAACFDAAGPSNILKLNLDLNELTTLPSGIFDSLTELDYLNVSNNKLTSLSPGVFDSLSKLTFLTVGRNDLTSLPSGIFDSLTEVQTLYISHNSLTTLPSGVFDSLTKLTGLVMDYNDLTTLPSGVFDSLTQLYSLNLNSNDLGALPSGIFAKNTELFHLSLQNIGLETLPSGIFDSLTDLFDVAVSFNNLSTLPAGIFDSLTKLNALYAIANPNLECVPTLPSSETDVNVDSTVGTECGCELPDGSIPCGEDLPCTPGAVGYTCGTTHTQAEPISLGCFKDVRNDRIMDLALVDYSMTTELCELTCAGSAYFSTQYGRECWCGPAETDYAQHGVSTGCTYQCAGNPDERCGGFYAANVYAYSTSSYVGCFKDSRDRIMELELKDASSMTKEICEAECTGRTYLGLQYGHECWCGDEDTDLLKHGESTACSFDEEVVATMWWNDSTLRVVEVFKSETGVEKYAVGEEFHAFTQGIGNSCGDMSNIGEEYLVDLVRRDDVPDLVGVDALFVTIPCGFGGEWIYVNEDQEESLRSCTCEGGCGQFQPPPGVYHYLNRPGAEPKWNGGSKWTGLPTARGWVSWTMALNTTLHPASNEQRLHGAEEPEDAIAVVRGDVGENDEMDMDFCKSCPHPSCTPAMASTDRAALVALYNATDGANWTNNTNWNTAAPLEQWRGVTANDQGRVVNLKLYSNNLKGHIPPQLGDLSALKRLDLSWNKIDGHIPPQLGDLSALKKLDLSWNKIDGHIPPQLGDLSALKKLDLSWNKIDGAIPAQLGALSMLTVLNLYKNQLSGPIPKELGALSALRGLELNGNQLSGTVPLGMWKLPRLGQVDISDNLLTQFTDPDEKTASTQEVLNCFERVERMELEETSAIAQYYVTTDGNPWEFPPAAVAVKGRESIRRYYDTWRQCDFSLIEIRALKVVLVGAYGAGKTSLARSLRKGHGDRTPEPDENRRTTVGVDLLNHKFRNGAECKIYDVAGKVSYYGLHQYFLTERAVYVIVWDATRFKFLSGEDLDQAIQENTLEWVYILHMRTPVCTVMLVASHCDMLVDATPEEKKQFLMVVNKRQVLDEIGSADGDSASGEASGRRRPWELRSVIQETFKSSVEKRRKQEHPNLWLPGLLDVGIRDSMEGAIETRYPLTFLFHFGPSDDPQVFANRELTSTQLLCWADELVDVGILRKGFARFLWNMHDRAIVNGETLHQKSLDPVEFEKILEEVGVTMPLPGHEGERDRLPAATDAKPPGDDVGDGPPRGGVDLLVIMRLPFEATAAMREKLKSAREAAFSSGNNSTGGGNRGLKAVFKFDHAGAPYGLPERIMALSHKIGEFMSKARWRLGGLFRLHEKDGKGSSSFMILEYDTTRKTFVIETLGQTALDFEAIGFVVSALFHAASFFPGVGWTSWMECGSHHGQKMYHLAPSDEKQNHKPGSWIVPRVRSSRSEEWTKQRNHCGEQGPGAKGSCTIDPDRFGDVVKFKAGLYHSRVFPENPGYTRGLTTVNSDPPGGGGTRSAVTQDGKRVLPRSWCRMAFDFVFEPLSGKIFSSSLTLAVGFFIASTTIDDSKRVPLGMCFGFAGLCLLVAAVALVFFVRFKIEEGKRDEEANRVDQREEEADRVDQRV
eukprot:g6339.t1